MKRFINNKSINTFTHNKFILYILLLLTLFNLISYLGENNLSAILLFLAVGLISTKYSKNMVIVLLISIIITNIVVKMGFLGMIGIKEGNTGMDDNKTNSDNTENKDSIDISNDVTEEEKQQSSSETQMPVVTSKTPMPVVTSKTPMPVEENNDVSTIINDKNSSITPGQYAGLKDMVSENQSKITAMLNQLSPMVTTAENTLAKLQRSMKTEKIQHKKVMSKLDDIKNN